MHAQRICFGLVLYVFSVERFCIKSFNYLIFPMMLYSIFCFPNNIPVFPKSDQKCFAHFYPQNQNAFETHFSEKKSDVQTTTNTLKHQMKLFVQEGNREKTVQLRQNRTKMYTLCILLPGGYNQLFRIISSL